MNQSILLVHISIESLLLFFFYFSAFRYSLLNISSLLNLLLMIFLTFSKISIYLIKLFLFLLRNKYVYFHQNFFLYNQLWREYAYRSNLFRIFINSEILKILSTKRKLIIHYYFINIYFVCRNRAFF